MRGAQRSVLLHIVRRLLSSAIAGLMHRYRTRVLAFTVFIGMMVYPDTWIPEMATQHS